jgi:hypothetical protein
MARLGRLDRSPVGRRVCSRIEASRWANPAGHIPEGSPSRHERCRATSRLTNRTNRAGEPDRCRDGTDRDAGDHARRKARLLTKVREGTQFGCARGTPALKNQTCSCDSLTSKFGSQASDRRGWTRGGCETTDRRRGSRRVTRRPGIRRVPRLAVTNRAGLPPRTGPRRIRREPPVTPVASGRPPEPCAT